MEKLITVVVVDDHLLIRQGIKSQLDGVHNIKLVGEGGTGEAVFHLVNQHKPNVLLLDIEMPMNDDQDGQRFQVVAAIPRLKKVSPDTAIIILSQYISSALIEESLLKGVSGYILKSDELTGMLPNAVEAVHHNGIFLSEGIRDKIQAGQPDQDGDITPRQREIILAIVDQPDLSYAEQAQRLGITEGALKNQLRFIYKQLNVSKMTSCVIECIKKGIIIIADK